MATADRLHGEHGAAVLEVTGMGEAHPLRFEPESTFGWHAYAALIDRQCDLIESDAHAHGVAAQIGRYASPNLTVTVHRPGDQSSSLHQHRDYPQGERRGTGGTHQLAETRVRDAGRFQRKNKIYQRVAKIRSVLLRAFPILNRYSSKVAREAHPELREAIENSSLIISDSMIWLIRNLALFSTQAIIVALRSRIDRRGQGMSLRRRRNMSLAHFALHECEQNQEAQNRVFVLQAGPDVEDTLTALAGNYSNGDSVLLLGSKSECMRDWASITKVGPDQWLYRGVPDAALKSGIPEKPSSGWPKISVITVSYNQADYIEACIQSVLEQGYPELEYIVVDGNSDDGTVEILERYRDRITKLIIEPDDGQSDALNKGFRLATGDVMTWVCSDDVLAENALFHIAKAFSDNSVDIVAGGCRVVNGAGDLTFLHHSAAELNRVQRLSFADVSNFLGNWQASDFFFQPEVFFSREIWEASGGFLREHLYYAMDYDLFLRMAMAGGKIVHIPRTIGVSRQHDQQKTQHGTMEYLPQIHGILSDYKAVVEACSTVNSGD